MQAAAKKSVEAYTPRFPHAHELLLSVYGGALKSEPENSSEWCDRFKAFGKTLEALKSDGVLPMLFVSTFGHDIRNVAEQVQGAVDMRTSTEQQKLMTFGMANLRSHFGSR